MFAIVIPPWIAGLKYIDLGAVAVFAVFIAACLLLRHFMPKTGAVAWVTAKESLAQPLFIILTLAGIAIVFLFLIIPYNTLGEDIKIFITQGLTIIKLFAAFLAVWTASMTIADELDGKTALMALSKPLSRTKFIVGKYAGVMIAVTLLFLIISTFFLNCVSYKSVYDAAESAKEVPTAAECFSVAINLVPGMLLAYFETVILAAIAITLSTRLPLLPNLTLVLAIYLLGNIVPVIVQSSAGQIPMVVFFADIISAVLPCLDHFSMETAVAMERAVPWLYVGYSAGYTFLYCSATLVVALLLFESRDLA